MHRATPGPKSAPRCSPITSSKFQDGSKHMSRLFQEAPRRPNVDPKKVLRCFEKAEESKRPQEGLEMTPMGCKKVARWPLLVSRMAQDGPQAAQDGRQDGPRREFQDCPEGCLPRELRSGLCCEKSHQMGSGVGLACRKCTCVGPRPMVTS